VIMMAPKDIVLGAYFLTKVKFSDAEKTDRRFSSTAEARAAYESGKLTLHQPVKVRIAGEIVDTTAGRIIFNDVLPDSMEFINRNIDKADIK